MTSGHEILSSVFRKNNLMSEYRKQEPIFVWSEVAGELGNIARPKEVKGNCLVLEVPSAAAKQELSFLEDEFLEKINEKLVHSKITGLKFQLGRFSRMDGRGGENFDLGEVELTKEERRRIEEAIEVKELDDRTKESLEQLLVTQLKKRKIRLENGWRECPSCGAVYPEKKCSCCGYTGR